MSSVQRVAVIGPTTLPGRECCERLVTLRPQTEVRGFTADDSEVGELVEFGRHGLLVEPLADFDAREFDAVVDLSAPTVEELHQRAGSLCDSLTRALRWVVLDHRGQLTPGLEGQPEVADELQPRLALPPYIRIHDDTNEAAELLVVPRASLTARLLMARALDELRPTRMTSTTITTASHYGSGGLDELLDQARSILSFSELSGPGVLEGQLAFNIRPLGTWNDSAASSAVGLRPTELHEQILEAGAFHGIGTSVFVEFEEPVAADEVKRSLSAHEEFEVRERVELTDASALPVVLIQQAEPDAAPSRRHWFWLAADHLTRVGSWAAAELALGADLESN